MMPLGVIFVDRRRPGAGAAQLSAFAGPAAAGPLAALPAGLGGAFLGGLLATWLGFGGLASWDLRSFVVAALAAMLALVAARLATLAS